MHEAASKQFHVKDKVKSNDVIASLGVTKPYFLLSGGLPRLRILIVLLLHSRDLPMLMCS